MFKKSIVYLLVIFLGTSVIVDSGCTSTTRSNTDKRIKKQKKRQKRNPGDCPRIDC
ncbi:MAG: hypothetical protein NZ529_10940 [Cytophagaceae bacterium]|nr:hypothetical protein [Cytophagaceae bacterium]MDW8457301.1 hypothetical protein [Cytophagaceae bacterium]